MSIPVGFPISSSPKSNKSSFIWKANPIFSPNSRAFSINDSSAPAEAAPTAQQEAIKEAVFFLITSKYISSVMSSFLAF